MAALAEAFASGSSAWVPLAKLFLKIEEDLGIPAEMAVRLLRPGFESCAIRTEVIRGNPTPIRINSGSIRFLHDGSNVGWARTPDAPHSVSVNDWQQIDWEAGTLRGCVVRVMWRDVQLELTPYAAALGSLLSAKLSTEAVELPALLALLPQHLRGDPKVCAAFAKLCSYAQEQVSEGRRPKRDDAARVVALSAGFPVRRMRELYHYLPVGWRNRSRNLQTS